MQKGRSINTWQVVVTGAFQADGEENLGCSNMPKHVARFVKEQSASGKFHALGRDWKFEVNGEGCTPASARIEYWST